MVVMQVRASHLQLVGDNEPGLTLPAFGTTPYAGAGGFDAAVKGETIHYRQLFAGTLFHPYNCTKFSVIR